MEYKLKSISQAGIGEANSKAELYRLLNEPEEAESICHDVLATDPENQTALRLLGLAISDQLKGAADDRYVELSLAGGHGCANSRTRPSSPLEAFAARLSPTSGRAPRPCRPQVPPPCGRER